MAHPDRIDGKRFKLVVHSSVANKDERPFFEALANRAALLATFRCGLKGGTVIREGKQTIYWIYTYNFDELDPPVFVVTAQKQMLTDAYARARADVRP